MNYLLFLISGTLSAWGVPLPGSIRKTETHPTKSGIIGLTATCLGITNTMEEEYTQLAKIGFACREDVPGNIMKDFQTVQIGPGIISDRYYLCEAMFTICLWETEKSPYTLSKISKALNKPRFIPFLGRKCCSLNAAPNPKLIKSENLLSAFKKYNPPKFLNFNLKEQKDHRIFWEGADQSIKIIRSDQRFDQPIGIRRYSTRIEHIGWEGGSDVSK